MRSGFGVGARGPRGNHALPASEPGRRATDAGARARPLSLGAVGGGLLCQLPIATAPLSTETPRARSGWIARYAWSSRVDAKGERRPSDYHKVLLKRLQEVEARAARAIRRIRVARLRRYRPRGGAGARRRGGRGMDGQEYLPDSSAAGVVWISGSAADLAESVQRSRKRRSRRPIDAALARAASRPARRAR